MPIQYNGEGDFLVDKKYVFEIGSIHKGKKQIEGIRNSFIVKDGLEYPVGNSLPLWVFGFLY